MEGGGWRVEGGGRSGGLNWPVFYQADQLKANSHLQEVESCQHDWTTKPPNDEVEEGGHDVNVPPVQSVFKSCETKFPPFDSSKAWT